MTMGSYFRYILYNRKYYLLPLMLLLFLLAEGANTAFFRLFGYFDLISSGTMGGWVFQNYWLALGFIELGYFLFLFCKYFITNYMVLKSNQVLH